MKTQLGMVVIYYPKTVTTIVLTLAPIRVGMQQRL